jgi:hypothetical protein
MVLPTFRVNSLDELRKVECKAVSRLNESQNFAQMFLLDPVGALASVGVMLSEEVVVEWGKLVGGTLPSMPKETRELMSKSTGTMQMRVTIHGILPPVKGSETEEQLQ